RVNAIFRTAADAAFPARTSTGTSAPRPRLDPPAELPAPAQAQVTTRRPRRVATPDRMQNRPDSPIRASAPDGRENRPDTHPLQDSYQHRTTARVGFASYRFRTNAKVGPAPHPLQDSYECQTDTRTGRCPPVRPETRTDSDHPAPRCRQCYAPS